MDVSATPPRLSKHCLQGRSIVTELKRSDVNTNEMVQLVDDLPLPSLVAYGTHVQAGNEW